LGEWQGSASDRERFEFAAIDEQWLHQIPAVAHEHRRRIAGGDHGAHRFDDTCEVKAGRDFVVNGG